MYKTAVESILQRQQETIESNPHFSREEKDLRIQGLEANRQSTASIIEQEKHDELRRSGERRLSYKAYNAAILINLYKNEPILQLPYRLLNILMDIDELIMQWRFNHAAMVHRMIGSKLGTGGSAGVNYLKTTVSSQYKVFRDLFQISDCMLPTAALPPLPASISRLMSFSMV